MVSLHTQELVESITSNTQHWGLLGTETQSVNVCFHQNEVMFLCVFIHTRVCMCIRVCVHVCLFCVRAHVRVCVHSCVNVCMCVCMCVCMRVCVCVGVSVWD